MSLESQKCDGGARAGTIPLGVDGRRAYYRVTGLLPIRLTPLAPEELEAAIFDLSLPDPLLQPVSEGEEGSPLMERLRRIEEKLDLLLGASHLEVPRQLCGRDRQSVVFSGSGLALDVTWDFSAGDHYLMEMRLPTPYSRVVRAICEAVRDAPKDVIGEGVRTLPLAIQHMETEDLDAMVAYSYDLQRFELRTRGGGAS